MTDHPRAPRMNTEPNGVAAMTKILCLLRGHDDIPVREVGVVARPGGMLPSLDGFVTYEPHPDGDHLACQRCRRVMDGAA